MLYKYQYDNESEIPSILERNTDKRLIEHQNITTGNFLIFTDEPLPHDEFVLIKQKIGELPPVANPVTLEEYRQNKIYELVLQYNQSLASGFTSSATGTGCIFSYGQSDREKFMQLAISVLSGIATFPVPIPDKEGDVVLHSQEQYQQLLVDISTFGWTMQNKLQTLIAQVKALATVEEVNAVVW